MELTKKLKIICNTQANALKADVGRTNLVAADVVDIPGLDVHTAATESDVAAVSQGAEREEGHVELGAAAHDEGPQCLVTTSPFVVDGHQVRLLGRLAVDNQLLSLIHI